MYHYNYRQPVGLGKWSNVIIQTDKPLALMQEELGSYGKYLTQTKVVNESDIDHLLRVEKTPGETKFFIKDAGYCPADQEPHRPWEAPGGWVTYGPKSKLGQMEQMLEEAEHGSNEG